MTCANGTRYRNRTCIGPFHYGANCTGSWDEEEICVAGSCPGQITLIIPFLIRIFY